MFPQIQKNFQGRTCLPRRQALRFQKGRTLTNAGPVPYERTKFNVLDVRKTFMGSTKDSRMGFTLVELLVVVSIIGLLSSTILAALSEARVKARNAQALQFVEQYKLAFELSYDADGVYPGRFGLPYLCVGDGYPYPSGGCGFDPPMPPFYAYSQRNVGLNNALARFIPSLPPRLTVISTSIGSYIGIEASCTDINPSNNPCKRGFRLFWTLEGADQNCGARATGFNLGNATFCFYRSSDE